MSTHASLRCRRRSVLLVAFIALAPAVALACIWDEDTLQQERSRFPETLELITGKFLRHSREFYEWRIKDRLEKLKADPKNLAYHDDLGVAYSKVGRTQDAIHTMEAKEKLKPGLYETYSNLGTFYILAGDFEKGLPYIDQALAINPNAHFGREKYQKWLVEYAISKKSKSGRLTFPLSAESENFWDFLQKKASKDSTVGTNSEAVKAVLGMMRFANYDNPLLLEALGDLMYKHHSAYDAQRLAARAYLQASYQMSDADARDRYRKLADDILEMQRDTRGPLGTSPNIEDDFKAELADAKKWYDELHAKELAWIRDGKNVEAEFNRLYTADPEIRGVDFSEKISPSEAPIGPPWPWSDTQVNAMLIAACALAAIVTLLTMRYLKRTTLARKV